jgi:uncharacterized protein YraI
MRIVFFIVFFLSVFSIYFPSSTAFAAGDDNGGCIFLLDCKNVPQPSPGPRLPPNPPSDDRRESDQGCRESEGSSVVVNVVWGDADNGLLLRTGASANAPIGGVIPADAVGLAVSDCEGSWCRVRYKCKDGWAGSRYLARESTQYRRVVRVSPQDPDGLNLRGGPGSRYPKVGSIPFNATRVINHSCQTTAVDGSAWCLVTYLRTSGWAAARFLDF